MSKSLRFLIGVVVVLAVGAAVGIRWGLQTLDQPAAMSGELTYQVPVHARFAQVAADLQGKGVVAHPRIWALYARWRGQAAQIKAGEYAIAPGTTPRSLLQQLIEGQVLLHSFTIVDGWQVRELLDALRHHPDIRATLPERMPDLMTHLGLPAQHAEGQFLPETYKVPAGTTDVSLLLLAHAALVKELDAAWTTRDPNLPLRSPEELLTLASIVEKETAQPSERAKIAGVYVQRLLTGMRLQADPTIIYGLGERYDGDIRTIDLRTDGPYNTYTRSGLPPTPIALAGAAAIRATAHPEVSGALFFVASGRGDGSHVFSTNLKDHNEAVARYLQQLRRHDVAPPEQSP
jgi:UPF0755 protein